MRIQSLRLLIDPPTAGAWNMAVDEALLESAIAGGPATLRFYSWQEPTLSLGYFQAMADREQHAASRGCPVVRRSSGGGAILHDRELTYSIALPLAAVRSSAAANELYDTVHETLVEALAGLGVTAKLYRRDETECAARDGSKVGEPFLCFQRRACGDVLCGEAKICGSAQRRRRGALLQHGSVLLARSRFAPELPGLAEQSGKLIDLADLRNYWQATLAERLGGVLGQDKMTDREHQRAVTLVEERFAAADFAGRH